MAITNEESNVKLSTEQLLALDKYEKRMNSMRMDIDTHAKNLEALRATNAILDSDRDNLTKCIEDLKPVVEQLKVQISGLNSNIAEAQNQLEKTRAEEILVKQEIATGKQDLADKTARLQANIEQHAAKETKLNNSILVHENDKQELAQKKAILLEAINKI